MKVAVLKQTLLQKISKGKQTQSPDPEYQNTRRAVHTYEKLSSQYAKTLKSWARKSETASKNQHEMGEIMIEAAEQEQDDRTKELLTRMGDCLMTVSDVQHSMLVRSVESIIFPFHQFQQDAKDLNVLHKYWLKTMAVYKAQLETCNKFEKTGMNSTNPEKCQQAKQDLSQKATDMDDALHESREKAYKMKWQSESENAMVQMFDMLHNYFKAGLEYTQEVIPIVEEYKKAIEAKRLNAPDKIVRITTPVDGVVAQPTSNESNGDNSVSAPSTSTLPPPPRAPASSTVANVPLVTNSRPALPPAPSSAIRKSVVPTKLPTPPVQATAPVQQKTQMKTQDPKVPVASSAPRPALPSIPSVTATPMKPRPIGYAIVAYDYEAQESTEITLKEGEFVFVYEKDEDGWGSGRNLQSNKVGEFPWNYVSDFVHGQHAIAEYDYDAQDDDEMPLREGDDIVVLIQEGDWWIGEVDGQIASFPANYCTLR
uniref:SH3 domain-containing protein n=1 Tax=Percolomonas cosmopolitus TaxID=63605 RepID=A0A7S1PHV9_9EUKA|eukprot:CAMPEP_0117444670 /NCGR_PEP_ID=MMETSP0759-20121206/5365_1 /TAXON_ID=63605 /ORGANISM="Percolomonas cosmopolitus, Strain WS" /LENGTH=482 /DNA_ID=CAMNT_0005236753 /DNA_START=87 /DNA_END=1535 /DNA_ORIENTATION=-